MQPQKNRAAIETVPGHSAQESGNRWLTVAVCFFLAAAVWAVFGQTRYHDFVNLDDDMYVYNNPVVARGITWRGIVWALTYGEIGHWHPLTWVTHMLDCQIYGLNPAGHHLTNVVLHAATTVLLFLALRNMTGALWRSAFVAAVFAIHPLRVESVAWVAERKDVLSGFFFMLTLVAYARYAQGVTSDACRVSRREPAEAAPASLPVTRHPLLFYWLALFFFALGLLSKSMLVTLPFVLLLLDYWPLGRLTSDKWRMTRFRIPVPQLHPECVRDSSFNHLLLEKLPFLLLSVASCAATSLVPETISSGNGVSFPLRFGNALVSYVTYLWQMIYPAKLAIPYLYPASSRPWGEVAMALALLAAISWVAIAGWRKRPYFAVGWLWYLGTLVPVIGFVRISYYAHADRYTYLPQIGLYILMTWGVADLCRGWRHRRARLGAAATAVLIGLLAGAYAQTEFWKDSTSLWTHTLACTPENPIAHNNLGFVLANQGKLKEAIQHYERALQIKPDHVQALNNLGVALAREGKLDEARQPLEQALRLEPAYADALNNLGGILAKQMKVEQAILCYDRALQIKPDYPEAHCNLGVALAQQGKLDEARQHFEQALQLNPDYADAHYDLGKALDENGQTDEAIRQYREAIRLKPDFDEAHNNLGTALYMKGQTEGAISQFQEAVYLKPDFDEAHNNLGTALLKQGQIDEAIRQYQEALHLNPDYADACYNLGNAFYKKGQIDEAIRQYRETIRLRPDYAKAYYNLGAALGKQGQIDEAIRQYQEALRLNPDYADACYNLGNAFYKKGQIDEAIRQYRETIRLRPDYAKACYNLGTALGVKGQIDEAIIQFQEALRLKPDFVEAQNNLAHALEIKNASAGR